MVVILLKNSDQDQFLYETTVDTSNDTLIRDLTHIYNERYRVQRLVEAASQLAMHGKAKTPEKQGLDEISERAGELIEKGEFYNADPLGMRDGNACDPKLGKVISDTCNDAMTYISKDQVLYKVALKKEILQEKVDNIRGAVMIAYPMGLPDYDLVRVYLEGCDNVPDCISPDTATLWWAGKEFFRDQKVQDRVGKNEKTKITVKLTKAGSGPPAREPVISEDERKAMMAQYFKKQEELKKLAEDDEDDYVNSSWANPKALKSALHGGGGVQFRAGGQVL